MPIQKNATKLFPEDCPLMKTNSELCFAFRVIAKKILRPYPEVPAQDAYATVKGAYSVDEDEANILALYLARPSWRSPSKDPIRMVSLPRVRWQQCMDDLLKRKLVVCDFDWENVDSAYSPDPAFVLSVQYDLCLAEAQEKPFRSFSSSPWTIRSENSSRRKPLLRVHLIRLTWPGCRIRRLIRPSTTRLISKMMKKN